MSPYADLYLLPVPSANLDAYKKVASKFGKIAREHGALSYREFVLDADQEGTKSFSLAAKPKEGEVVIAAVVDFKSRSHRDQVLKKIFKDPRLEKMQEEAKLFDMKKMFYSGFKTIVKA